MKKYITSSLIAVILIAAVLALYIPNKGSDALSSDAGVSSKGNESILKISDLIASKKGVESFSKIRIFSSDNAPFGNGITKGIKQSARLKIDRVELTRIMNLRTKNLLFEIPLGSGKLVELELTEAKVFSDDFSVNVLSDNGTVPVNYKPGLFYRGIVKGDNSSIAAVSLFDNSVMGVVSTKDGNFNLGPAEGGVNDTYIYYNDRDLSIKNDFKCGVEDIDSKLIKPAIKTSGIINDNPAGRLPVKIYFEADYQTYVNKGFNTTNVSNYISGFFNSVALIYQNEYLPVQISTINVWSTPDPYMNLTDSYRILLRFGGRIKDNFTGDLAQLVSTRQEGFGGIAWVRTICGNFNPNDSSGRFSFSGIDTNYYYYPTYSWTINVVTHELGHSFGSMHTHACWWPVNSGVIGPIDSCYYAEGGCFQGTKPAIGTIMSYCHLQTQAGGYVDLRLGFGSMPGDTIRLRYNQCSRFGQVINSSENPTVFSMFQNFPNPFNPATTISFAVPENANITLKIYDINGREITTAINSRLYATGVYNYFFNASAYSLASGIYFYKITAQNPASKAVKFTEVKRMILIK